MYKYGIVVKVFVKVGCFMLASHLSLFPQLFPYFHHIPSGKLHKWSKCRTSFIYGRTYASTQKESACGTEKYTHATPKKLLLLFFVEYVLSGYEESGKSTPLLHHRPIPPIEPTNCTQSRTHSQQHPRKAILLEIYGCMSLPCLWNVGLESTS